MFPKPTKSVKTKKRIARKSKNPLPRAKDRAWNAFSKWVRVSNADYNGNVRCFTCGVVKHWKEMDAGHYFHNVLDFNIYNIHPQCSKCNKYLQGNGVVYYEKLREMYGQEVIEEMLQEKYKIVTLTIEDYNHIEAEYKEKIKAFSHIL